jgi:hypothetical protein
MANSSRASSSLVKPRGKHKSLKLQLLQAMVFFLVECTRLEDIILASKMIETLDYSL